MATLASQLLELIARNSGHTDRELAEMLGGRGAIQQPINQEARLLASRNLLIRQKRPDGLIGNYPNEADLTATDIPNPRRRPLSLPALPRFSGADELIAVVSTYVRLPNSRVVSALNGAVFPSIRDQRNRIQLSVLENQRILLDDNTTPRWAMLWSHGFGGTAHPKGWAFAHVWARPKDPYSYTNVANIAMMPEYLASLSDKDGPLGAYLRYHSWVQYGWKPNDADEPEKPDGYEAVSWSYLREESDPIGFIKSRVDELDNKRCRLLRVLR